jgi:CDP-glycerol glycerophosphotransferase (TagB/SpsB family)
LHILVRYRPATPEIPADQIRNSDHVSFSQPCQYFFPIKTAIAMSRKDWEFDEADLQLMINSLYFSDIMINTFSTLTIDAVAYDKPMIGIRYDADMNTPPIHSVKYVPDRHDHYRELEDTGGVRLVYDNNQLIDAINAYLKNPALDREGRERMRREQIQFYDGLCGKREADYVKNQIFN